MTSATHFVSICWEYIAQRSVENIADCPIPGRNLHIASPTVIETDSGRPMPNGDQPTTWLVLNGVITSMVAIKGKSHIVSCMQQEDTFLNTNPHEFSKTLRLLMNRQIMDSPLALSRKCASAKENSIIVGTPIRLLFILMKRHPEWYRFATAALLRLVACHTYREYRFLTISTEECYLTFLQEYPRLAARMPQREVAQYLGLILVSPNRVVSWLRRCGAILWPASREYTA